MTKLELTWVGKDEPMQKIEPRLLLHHKEKSYGEAGFASQDKYVVRCDAICVIDARGGKETARGHSKEYSQAA